MKFSNEDIIKVVQYYNFIKGKENISLKFHIICSFCSDDKASCYIDGERGSYYCFACGASGDVLSFIKRIEKCDPLKAMLIYTKAMNGENGKGIKINKPVKKVSIKEALKEAKIYFYSISKPSWYCIKNSYMHKRGFNSIILEEQDIKIDSDEKYRVICPIRDCRRFRGYVKRRTDGNNNENKYLYNKGFRRKLIVMGDYDLGGWVPITEGYMDWLKLIQNGCDNAVAIFGWEMMPKQIEKVKNYTNYVISALDNTPTGEKGTELLKQHFKKVIRFQFPENCKDVGDLSNIQFKKAWLDTMTLVKKYVRRRRKNVSKRNKSCT